MKCRPVLRLSAVVGYAIVALAGATAPVGAQDAQKPYTVQDGKVDKATYNGFRRYHSTCHVCHGPDGLGSSFAPNLTDSLKTLGFDEFVGIVAAGREREVGHTVSKMPSFAQDPNVMDHIEDIYAYLKARSDGALGRGRPDRLEQK